MNSTARLYNHIPKTIPVSDPVNEIIDACCDEFGVTRRQFFSGATIRPPQVAIYLMHHLLKMSAYEIAAVMRRWDTGVSDTLANFPFVLKMPKVRPRIERLLTKLSHLRR